MKLLFLYWTSGPPRSAAVVRTNIITTLWLLWRYYLLLQFSILFEPELSEPVSLWTQMQFKWLWLCTKVKNDIGTLALWNFTKKWQDGGMVMVRLFVYFQSVIQMPGFRSLGDDEEVEFECKESDKGLEATRVSGPSSVDCQGSHRRPLAKKRFRKIR